MLHLCFCTNFHAIINKNFAFNFKYFKPKINNQKKKVFLILPDNAISPQIMATELIEFKKKFKKIQTEFHLTNIFIHF